MAIRRDPLASRQSAADKHPPRIGGRSGKVRVSAAEPPVKTGCSRERPGGGSTRVSRRTTQYSGTLTYCLSYPGRLRGRPVIIAAIIALGASGLILMLLAVANPRIDVASDSPRPSNVVPLRVITRSESVTTARRYARPAMEVRVAFTREQEPPRRTAMRKSWWKQRRDAAERGYRRTQFVAGTVACSIALGLVIAHLSV